MRRRPLEHARHTLIIAFSLAALTTAEGSAFALQGGEDPALLPVLVDKRFGEGRRFQLTASLATAMATKFVEATGPYISAGYGFSDLFALEINGGYFFASESSIMQEIRRNFPGAEPLLSDMYQPTWIANVDLVLVPIYGKISFASEFDPSFDLFLIAGGGGVGVRRQVGKDATGDKHFDSATTWTANFGLGFRFYFTRLLALRLEFRDFFYPEPECKDPVCVAPFPTGFTFNLMFHGGLQFSFGGDQ